MGLKGMMMKKCLVSGGGWLYEMNSREKCVEHELDGVQ